MWAHLNLIVYEKITFQELNEEVLFNRRWIIVDCDLSGCDTMQSCRWLPTFLKKSITCLQGNVLLLHSYPKYGVNTFLQYVYDHP